MYGRYYKRRFGTGRYYKKKRFVRRTARKQAFRGRRNYRRW